MLRLQSDLLGIDADSAIAQCRIVAGDVVARETIGLGRLDAQRDADGEALESMT